MSELLNHWKLVTQPFEGPWDTRFFYRSEQHQEALDRLTYLTLEGGMSMGLLTGEIGCGKTLVRSVLQHSLPASQFRIVVLENSGFCMDELVAAILRRLDAPQSILPEGRLACLDLLEQFLEAEADQGRQVIVILDEAQDMSLKSLDELRWLTNFNGGGRHLLTVILIGQPDLQSLVEQVPAIDQRVSLRYHLQPLSEQDIPDYLAHRLYVAGHPNGQIFDPGACTFIHQISRGVPREVNRLAKLALEYAWVCGLSYVEAEHLEVVAQDMHCHPNITV